MPRRDFSRLRNVTKRISFPRRISLHSEIRRGIETVIRNCKYTQYEPDHDVPVLDWPTRDQAKHLFWKSVGKRVERLRSSFYLFEDSDDMSQLRRINERMFNEFKVIAYIIDTYDWSITRKDTGWNWGHFVNTFRSDWWKLQRDLNRYFKEVQSRFNFPREPGWLGLYWREVDEIDRNHEFREAAFRFDEENEANFDSEA